jgi:hypothetical protein
MLLDIADTMQTSIYVLTGRVAGLSRLSNMDICSNPTVSSANNVAIDLTLFLCACYNADVADMSVRNMLAGHCQYLD